MNTDATQSISGTAGIAGGWSARIASGAAEPQTTRSKLTQHTIEDLLETTDRDADGTRSKPSDSQPPPHSNNPVRANPDLPTGSLLDWRG